MLPQNNFFCELTIYLVNAMHQNIIIVAVVMSTLINKIWLDVIFNCIIKINDNNSIKIRNIKKLIRNILIK